eukprot:2158002-Amphidinium_carterae.2
MSDYDLYIEQKAELYAIGTTANDVIYVRKILQEIQFPNDKELKPTIYTNSSSAICLAQQLGSTNALKRTKHVDICYLHVQQLQHERALRIHKVCTADNPANLMTKYLETTKIKRHSQQIGRQDKIGSSNMPTNHLPRPKYTFTAHVSTPRPSTRSLQLFNQSAAAYNNQPWTEYLVVAVVATAHVH